MDIFDNVLNFINGLVWGPYMMALILGTGLFLMVRLNAQPLRKIGYGFKQLSAGRKGQGEGEISPFKALMTSLSATIGTGNIVGVATAIGLGGPGALFGCGARHYWGWLLNTPKPFWPCITAKSITRAIMLAARCITLRTD